MAQDTYAHLVGVSVELTDDKGPLKPCMHCGVCSASITAGTAIHHAGLRCDGCDRHIGWLSGKHLDAIGAMEKLRRAS